MNPSTEPCGTQEETGIVLELMPLVTTDFAYYLKSPKARVHIRNVKQHMGIVNISVEGSKSIGTHAGDHGGCPGP